MTETDSEQRPLVTIGGQEVQLEAQAVPQGAPVASDITVVFEPVAAEPRSQSFATGVQETDTRPAAAGLLTFAIAVILLLILLRWRVRAARRD